MNITDDDYHAFVAENIVKDWRVSKKDILIHAIKQALDTAHKRGADSVRDKIKDALKIEEFS